MEDLEVLRLNENEMDMGIPDSLYTLHKLKMLWLHDTVLCNDDGLECVIDSDTGFSGTISTEIGNLKKLSSLLIHNNPFEGTIPTEIGLCENLGKFCVMLCCFCVGRTLLSKGFTQYFHTILCFRQPFCIYTKPILKVRPLWSCVASATRISTTNIIREFSMLIADPTTRPKIRSLLVSVAQIAAITLLKFVLQMIRAFLVCLLS